MQKVRGREFEPIRTIRVDIDESVVHEKVPLGQIHAVQNRTPARLFDTTDVKKAPRFAFPHHTATELLQSQSTSGSVRLHTVRARVRRHHFLRRKSLRPNSHRRRRRIRTHRPRLRKSPDL